MATVVTNREDVFKVGTSVAAYAAVAGPLGQTPRSGAPPGSSVDSATVQSDGTLTLDLPDDASYILYASSPDRYLRVNVFPAASSGGGDVTQEDLDDAVSTHSADTTAVHGVANTAVLPRVNVFNVTWPTRPDATIVFWIGGDASDDDPSADMEVGDVWFPHSE